MISFGRGEATDEPARDARPTENRKLRRYWRTAAVDICKRLFLSSFVTRLEKDGVRWELDDEFSSLLEKVLGSSKRTIKESPAKLVTAHQVGEKTYFVKRYRSGASPLRSFKFFLKPSQARKEWRLAQRLHLLQVPTVRHAALGERWNIRGLQESILITEGFAGSGIDEGAGVPPAAVLRFLEGLNAKGVIQSDLHPGNILVHPLTKEMRLVDLHGIRIQSAVSPAHRDANLAFLNIFFPLPLSPQVQQLSRQLRKDYYAYRSKRCLKVNREFARKTFGPFRWHVRIPFLNAELEKILADPDNFLEARAQMLKRGRSATVGCVAGIVVKRFNLRKLSRFPVDLFRSSRARRAYCKAYHLELAGIATARPIATADKRIARFLFRSYLVMEEIHGAVDLAQWRGSVRQGIQSVAELLAKLHCAGFSHRDLKETNIVFDSQANPHLLDLEGLKYIRTVPPRRAAADLLRLDRAAREKMQHVSQSHRQAFLRAYCKARGVRPRDLFPRREK